MAPRLQAGWLAIRQKNMSVLISWNLSSLNCHWRKKKHTLQQEKVNILSVIWILMKYWAFWSELMAMFCLFFTNHCAVWHVANVANQYENIALQFAETS